MMRQLLKTLLIFLLLIATIATCFAQFPYNENYGPKPKGKIDSVITPRSGREQEISIFNKKGQLAEYYEYRFFQNPDFNIQTYDTTRTVYSYDKKGCLSKSIRYSWAKTDNKIWHDTVTTIWHFVIEGNGYLAKFDDHYKDGSTRHRTFKLNSVFQLIEETDSLKNVEDKTYVEDNLNTYDKNGYLVRRHRTSKSHGEIFNYDEYYTNDADGNIIVRATNGPIFKFTYTRYDKRHNWMQRNNYKLDPEEIDEDYLMDTTERRITYFK